MSSADAPQQPPSREPEPAVPGRATPDPFEGLVLDERLIGEATVKEPTARTRMLAARWREEPPVDPGGRRWTPGAAPGAARGAARSRWIRRGRRRTVLITATAFAALLAVAVGMDPAGVLNRDGRSMRSPRPVPGSPRPTVDVALPGGGVSDGTRCGTKGFHHFEPAPASFTFAGSPTDTPPPGPQLVLSAYGFSRGAAQDPGHFTIGLGLAPGPGGHALDLSAPLGPQGVAVEIEGPDGLVAGAHGLPLTHGDGDGDAPSDPGGTVHVGPEGGASVQVTLPAAALCPGFDGFAVQQRLTAPTDSNNTVTGQPPYRLTVSIADPAIGALRRQLGSTVPGDVLATDNRVQR
ncbi:hypothetical protein AB0F71_12820 [Kitasatospora sp. NPDC028055]|uniref:SCO2583/SCO2584 N-terminal domain-containing protein n=1 Tax=Kitasatospora sp. NPDC028055 TaxID=3155653 RepID=UPI0033C6171C